MIELDIRDRVITQYGSIESFCQQNDVSPNIFDDMLREAFINGDGVGVKKTPFKEMLTICKAINTNPEGILDGVLFTTVDRDSEDLPFKKVPLDSDLYNDIERRFIHSGDTPDNAVNAFVDFAISILDELEISNYEDLDITMPFLLVKSNNYYNHDYIVYLRTVDPSLRQMLLKDLNEDPYAKFGYLDSTEFDEVADKMELWCNLFNEGSLQAISKLYGIADAFQTQVAIHSTTHNSFSEYVPLAISYDTFSSLNSICKISGCNITELVDRILKLNADLILKMSNGDVETYFKSASDVLYDMFESNLSK